MMITNINVSSEVKQRIAKHRTNGETFEEIIVRLLDLDDQYGSSEPMEFEAVFDEDIIKVFKVDNTLIEYFTPARKFSTSFHEWNLPDKYYDDWVRFITSEGIISVLLSMDDDDILECGCFKIRQI